MIGRKHMLWILCNLELLRWRFPAVDVKKPGWNASLRSLGWFTCSDFNWLYNRFLYVPHIGPRFTGLKRSQSAVRFWQRKSGLCLWDVGIWTLIRSCVNTTGQLAIFCFQELLQRMIYPFQFLKTQVKSLRPQGPSDTAGSEQPSAMLAGRYSPKGQEGVWVRHQTRTPAHTFRLIGMTHVAQASLYSWGLGFTINWLVGPKFATFQTVSFIKH